MLVVTVVVAWEQSVFCCSLLGREWKRCTFLNALSSGSANCWGCSLSMRSLVREKQNIKKRGLKVTSKYMQNVLMEVVNLPINASNFVAVP